MWTLEQNTETLLLFDALANAREGGLLGHSIGVAARNCQSKEDFDKLVSQLKDYVYDCKVSLCSVLGSNVCKMIQEYKLNKL
jgi:hypothetical protein